MNEEYIIECGCRSEDFATEIDAACKNKHNPDFKGFCRSCGKRHKLRPGKIEGLLVELEYGHYGSIAVKDLKNLVAGKKVDYTLWYP